MPGRYRYLTVILMIAVYVFGVDFLFDLIASYSAKHIGMDWFITIKLIFLVIFVAGFLLLLRYIGKNWKSE